MWRAIIVDDEPIIRFGIQASVNWSEEGIEVIGDYANGAEALERLQQSPESIDILITDIKMPLMDGLTLTRLALEHNSEIKVILVSSHNDFDYVREGLKLGVVDYILKHTLEPEELLLIVRKCKAMLEEDQKRRMASQEWALHKISSGLQDLDAKASLNPIDKAVAYIRIHYLEALTLQQVADVVHVSKNYFSILFKKFTGQNFIDFVLALRIQRAKELLNSTDMKVYEVAEQSGFNDVKYFSKLFKKMTGYSPIDYREYLHQSPNRIDSEKGAKI